MNKSATIYHFCDYAKSCLILNNGDYLEDDGVFDLLEDLYLAEEEVVVGLDFQNVFLHNNFYRQFFSFACLEDIQFLLACFALSDYAERPLA